MADQSKQSKTDRFIRGAGDVHDPNKQLWAPARWVVQMVQYLIAIILISQYPVYLSSYRRGFQIDCQWKDQQQKTGRENQLITSRCFTFKCDLGLCFLRKSGHLK